MDPPDWARVRDSGPRGLPSSTPASAPACQPPSSPSSPGVPTCPCRSPSHPPLEPHGELLGGSAAPTEAVPPGDTVSLTIPSGATGISVTRPDGTATELVPGVGARLDVTFVGTDLTGIDTVTPIAGQPDASAAP